MTVKMVAREDDDNASPAPQLNGDARLQFWRDVYLAALPPILATLPQGNATTLAVLGCTRLASDAADAALAQHLSRNDRDELDSLLDELLAVPDPSVPK